MEYLLVGTIVKTVGLKGEVKIYPSTHFRDSRFKVGNHLFLLDENHQLAMTLTIKKHHKNGDCDQVVFEEISSIDEAQVFVRRDLFVEKDRSFLKKDTYFFDDLQGCTVYFDNGSLIGKVIKVEEYNSYATLRVDTGDKKKSVLIPFVNAFVKDINIDEKKIIVKFIEGLV